MDNKYHTEPVIYIIQDTIQFRYLYLYRETYRFTILAIRKNYTRRIVLGNELELTWLASIYQIK